MKKFLNWLKDNWGLVLVVIIGGLLRFYRLQDLTTFGGDQGIDYQNVARMVVEKRLSLLGPVTHVGVFLGPLYYYLLIPFFLIFKFDPIATPVMFGLFGTTTVGLVYILAKLLLRPGLAGQGQAFVDIFVFLTALLYAVSPVILESSRAPSQPHLIPFFATLLLISIVRIVEKRDKWWDWVLTGICLASVIQFHFLAFPLWIFTAIILVVSKGLAPLSGARPYKIFLLAIPAVVLLFPWFLFEIRHNFFITNQILAYLRSGEVEFHPIVYMERVLDLIWFSFDKLIGQGNQFITLLSIIFFLFATSTFYYKKESPLRRDNRVFFILISYFWLNIFGIALYKFPFSNHYISALYPIIVLLFSIGVFQIMPRLLAFITFLIFIFFIFLHNNFTSNHGYTMPEWVNASLIQKAAEMITGDIKKQAGTYNVVNTLDGDTRANPYRYVLMYKYKVAPLGVEKYPEADHLYIVTRNRKNELLDDRRWELASFPVEMIEDLGMIGGDIKMYRWDNGSADRKDLRE
ncbi:hypothetical protein HYU89_02990 [Candidatus Collierbacteria bacterium]|nr:hypothetical protein [Candidatus Collierbacteria bacterium]